MLLSILWVLLWILLGLLGLVLLLLLLPVDARLDVERYAATRALVRARYCLGLASAWARVSVDVQELEVRVLGFRIWRRTLLQLIASQRKKAQEPQDEKAKKKEKKADEDAGGWPGIPPHLGWVLGRALWALKVRGEVQGVYGFDDPGTTGMVEGLRAGVAAAVPALALEDLAPDFTREVLYGHARLSFQVWIPRLVVAAAGFFLDRRGREFVRHWSKKPPEMKQPAHAVSA